MTASSCEPVLLSSGRAPKQVVGTAFMQREDPGFEMEIGAFVFLPDVYMFSVHIEVKKHSYHNIVTPNALTVCVHGCTLQAPSDC